MRSFYIFLALDLDLALDLVGDLAPARARTHNLALDLALARALDLKLAYDLAPARVRALDLALGPGAGLDYMLTIVFQSGLVIPHRSDKIQAQIDEFIAYVDRVAQEANESSPQLATALAGLSVPAESSLQSAWQDFNQKLRQLMLDQRDLGHDWNLSEEQVNTLATYLQANRLLLECLEVAYVDDREAIKDSLLLLPGEWEF